MSNFVPLGLDVADFLNPMKASRQVIDGPNVMQSQTRPLTATYAKVSNIDRTDRHYIRRQVRFKRLSYKNFLVRISTCLIGDRKLECTMKVRFSERDIWTNALTGCVD